MPSNQARSVIIATIADAHYLFVGLGDGHVVSFPLEEAAESGLVLGMPKKVALGTQPVGLACFRNNGMVCVFVASDRPAVIYCSGGKLLYANVNMGEVCICRYHFSILSGVHTYVLAVSRGWRRCCKIYPFKLSKLAELHSSKHVPLIVCDILDTLSAGRSTPCAHSTLVSSPTVWHWRVKIA